MKTRNSLSLAVVIVLASSIAASAFGEERKEVKKEVKTREVKVRDITLNVPETWKQITPTSRFRAGQFAIPAVDGDKEAAELVIFTFGGGGGGVDANVKRWTGQFQAKGRKTKTTTGKSRLGEYVLVDLTGTYNKPIGPPVQRKTKATPGSRMLGVILAIEKKGNYFLKLTGPEKTVTAATKAFRKSFGANASKEKEYKSDS